MSFFDELKRRKVFRVGAVYAATAFVVLQAADLLVEALGLPTAVLTATTIVSLIGFPVALVLAWVFEISTEETSPETPSATAVVLPRRTVVLIGVLLLAGIGIGWVLKPGAIVPDPPDTDARPSIAVLPFENASPDPDNQFFSYGMAEEIIYALDRLPGLDVKARTSTWQFAESNISAQQVADSIDATSVLAGRVQRDGDAVRISVELVRGSDGEVMWQDRFDGTVDDLFDTQARIAAGIAGNLQIRLAADQGAPARLRTRSPDGYDRFLRGRYNLALRTTASVEAAIRDFEAAIAADSAFALAWAGLGEAWMLGAVYGIPARASEIWTNANMAANRAIAMDPELPQPHATRGYMRYLAGRWEDAEAPLRRALELDPGYTDAMQWLAEVYSRLGRANEAERLVDQALSREPYSRGVVAAGEEVYLTTDLEAAESYALRLVEMGALNTGLLSLMMIEVLQGRFEGASTHIRQWLELVVPDGQADAAMVTLQATLDEIERYQTTGQPGEVHPGVLASPMQSAWFHPLVGRLDRGIAAVERRLDEDDPRALMVLTRLPFWQHRDDPDFQALRARFGEVFSNDVP